MYIFEVVYMYIFKYNVCGKVDGKLVDYFVVKCFNDTTDLIYKLSASLKKEEIPKNEILFLNGQLGKTFYLIIQGEVSVLMPIQCTVQITCSQFYQYMDFK